MAREGRAGGRSLLLSLLLLLPPLLSLPALPAPPAEPLRAPRPSPSLPAGLPARSYNAPPDTWTAPGAPAAPPRSRAGRCRGGLPSSPGPEPLRGAAWPRGLRGAGCALRPSGLRPPAGSRSGRGVAAADPLARPSCAGRKSQLPIRHP